LRECPIDHRCMTRVETSMVESQVLELVALSAHDRISS
jgi:hypothetical protein